LEATNVVVAGTGTVWVAPEGTALPVDITTPLPAAWTDIGYISEDGATFTISRDTEDIMAWQSSEAVRVLVTAEPKTVAFELLEFDRESILLAFRGGAFAGATPPYTYTPPSAGATDIRALVVDGVDGAYTFRFCFPRVQLQGDVEWALQRTDAIRLPLEFALLAAATPWSIISDHPSFGVPVALASLSRAELDAQAEAAGLDPSDYSTKAELIEALEAQQAGAVA
jgi:hypothetical protein